MKFIEINYKKESERLGKRSKKMLNQSNDPQKAIENYLNAIIKKAV